MADLENNEPRESKLTFPCEFTFKIIGLANPDFEGEVLKILNQYFPQLGEGAIRLRLSKNQKYLAMTVVTTAESQAQLDATYMALTNSPHVLFAL